MITMDGAETAVKPRTGKLLGEILVSEGVISRQQLEAALKLQKAEREKTRGFDLSMYLVEKGYMDKAALEAIEKKYKINQRLGEALVGDGVITREELSVALREKKPSQFLGETLVKLGHIDRSQLYECLKQQLNVPSFQTILVNENVLSEEELRSIMSEHSLARSLGEILAGEGFISVQQLYRILKKYKKRRPIGEMLVEAGLISREQLELALEKQKFFDAPLGETLIKESLISEVEFHRVLARQFAMDFRIMNEEAVGRLDAARLRNLVGPKDAMRYRVVPLDFVSKRLTLALFDPFDIERLEGFDSIINFKTALVLVRKEDFETVYRKIYGEEPKWDEMDEGLGDMIQESLDISLERGRDEAEQVSMYVAPDKDSEAEKLVNLIISYGIASKASDIHIENDPDGIHVRYRIDGMLRELRDGAIRKRLQAKAMPVTSRIKVMSDLDIAERRLPQDGAFRMSIYDNERKEKVNLDFRVAICKGVYGENVTMRILDSRKANVRLDQLSHSHDMLGKFVKILRNPSGMILVTGPTGSGKTSTLYAGLHYLNHPNVKIITAEDPVEFKVRGLMQTQAEPKIGLTFARLLKSFLRLDPDILMVGEIRDRETANIAVEAALTGHLVLSSLHTNDAIGAVARLRDLDLSNLQIASALKGVLAQRLTRAICPNCKRQYTPDEEEWGVIFPEEPIHMKFYKGEGCVDCNYSGYRGRIAISELLPINAGVAKAVLDNGDENVIYEAAKREGMKNMVEDGLEKLDQTTLSEIVRVTPPEALARYRAEFAEFYSRFPRFEPPDGAQLEYQTILTRTKKGFSKERVNELYSNFKNVRKRLKEPTDYITPDLFASFLDKELSNKSGGDGGTFRVSVLNRDRRAAIMAEFLKPGE
ncbi:MAG: ATPase, T2SS/T4P/T4SS family [Candidatus Nitrospinota bacterium M3_3B_026]